MSYSNKIVFKNVVWICAERMLAQIVAFVVTVVLSRILSPADYGTVALVAVFVAILEVFSTRGFNQALIQKKEIEQKDYSTIFWSNLTINTILYLLVFFCAPIIAKFYSNDELVLMLRILGIRLILSGFNAVQQAYVQRNMMFKKFFYSTLFGTILSGIVGIVIAVNGGGPWAFISQDLTNAVVDMSVLFFTIDWKPKFEYSIASLKNMLGYGLKMLVSGILDSIYENLRSLIIGKKYSAADLAFYNKGRGLPNMVISNTQSAASNVFFSALSREDSKENIKIKMRQYLSIMFFLIAPLMCGLACVSKDVIYLIFSEKWLPATPFVIIYCFSYLSWVPQTPIIQALYAFNKVTVVLLGSIVHRGLGLVMLFLLINYGPVFIAYGALTVDIFITVFIYIFAMLFFNYTCKEILEDVGETIVSLIVMMICVCFIGQLINRFALRLILEIITGATVYILFSFIMKNRNIKYAKEVAKNAFNKK